MKRRRVLISVATVLVVTVLAVVLLAGEREPACDGKKLSEWLSKSKPVSIASFSPASTGAVQRIFLVGGTRNSAETVAAVRWMGTNGVEALVRWMSYEPPKWRLKVRIYSQSLPKSCQRWRFYRWLRSTGEERAIQAAAVLAQLSLDELPVRELELIQDNRKTPRAAARARRCLIRSALRRNLLARCEILNPHPCPFCGDKSFLISGYQGG